MRQKQTQQLQIIQLYGSDEGADIGLGQPVWKHHECMMMPMEDHFRILDGLRREVVAMKK